MKEKILFGVKIVFLILIVIWISIVILDYFNARNEKNPEFCVNHVVHIYESDGTQSSTISYKEFQQMSEEETKNMSYTIECLGLGYKIYQYHRDFRAIEFGPFFIKERQSIDS